MSEIEVKPMRQEELLGSRLRAFRLARKLTLKQVSTRAGVSESFLSQVERGASSVSVSTLHSIATAIGLTVADLFDEGGTSHRVLHPKERPMITVSGVRKFMLTRQPLQSLEVLECEYDPGAFTGGPENAHGDSQELLLILDGEFIVEIGSESHSLSTGDSVEYRSSTPHAVKNVSTGVSRALFIITPPSL